MNIFWWYNKNVCNGDYRVRVNNMTIQSAKEVVDGFWRKNGNVTEDDCFLYTEALDFLIWKTNDCKYMTELGQFYYEQKEFSLAVKYLEMSASNNNAEALISLGYIWYYGRTGKVDYEKAFECFSRAKGNVNAEYKLADMYKNGYYVPKDYDKYKSMIEQLYDLLKDTVYIDSFLPDICLRLGEIREKENRKDEAYRIYVQGKDMLASRIAFNPFFGDFNIMQIFIKRIYSLADFCTIGFDLYGLYYLKKSPCTVRFTYKSKNYVIELVDEDGKMCAVKFLDKWYKDVDEFLQTAKIGNSLMTLEVYDENNFEVI